MLRRDAIVLDTETTDLHGRICELAVVDVHGTVLLDSLVNPGCPIARDATRVHGITDRDVASAPRLDELLPQLIALAGDRPILAYNAPYDRAALLADAARLDAPLGGLGRRNRWGCLMRARAAACRAPWARLDAGHRAAGDAAAASTVLWEVAYLTPACHSPPAPMRHSGLL